MKKVMDEKVLLNAIQISVLALVVALVSACRPAQQRDDKFVIVTTTGMIKDAVQQVTGDKATVIALMGPGVDPHLYKASQGDLDKLTSADIIFYNGLHLEGKMGEVLEKLARLKPVVPVASGMPDTLLRKVPGFQGAYDPHIWFDVSLWKYAVRTIEQTIAKEDTAHAAVYRSNAARYTTQLDSLHKAVTATIHEIPEAQRVLITAHDAFGYFGDAYHIEVRGLQGISTVAEFGLKDRIDLIDFIIDRKIKAIFVETSVSQRSIEAVQEGCRKQGWEVVIGGSLYSDAMGEEGTPEGTYIGMVHANVNTIVNALK